MVTVRINDRLAEVEAGTTVLAAARQAGIFIPTLCDHPALHPSGGCRLCMVEVQGARGPQTACTLPVSAGMVVATDTPALRASRQFVLNMLFSENNHICPFCPVSGGDCELQNAAYHEQMTHWPYLPEWQPQAVDASADDFIFDPNRCILCRRCVRACDELVGNCTLGVAQRGAKTHLVADGGIPLGASSCIGCGTCVQICPTGALFGKRTAYQGLNAQTESTPSICLGCSVGCGVAVVTRGGRLVRIDGDWLSPVSGGLLCRVGRFEPLEDGRTRVLTPLVRRAGKLSPASWEDALSVAAAGLPGGAGYISPRLPGEALTAFQQLLLSQPPFDADSAAPSVVQAGRAKLAAEADLDDLRAADLVILLGAEVEHDHQVIGFFIKRGLPRGLKLAVIDPIERALDSQAALVLRPKPGAIAPTLRAWQAALQVGIADEDLRAAAAQAGFSVEHLKTLVSLLAAAKQPVLVHSASLAAREPEAVAWLHAVARQMPRMKLLALESAANSRLAQYLGLTQPFTPLAGQPVLLDLGDEAPSHSLIAAAQDASFRVVAASYCSPVTEIADVVLPVETAFELSGHYLNVEGRWQFAQRALVAPGEVRSNAAVLGGLAERLGQTIGVAWPVD
jgi:formate dehydrogenase major subunit